MEESGVLVGPISEIRGISHSNAKSHRKPKDRVVQIPPLLLTMIPKVGDVYMHYKGKKYKVVLVSKLESNPEQILVSYIPLYETPHEIKEWTRTLENFQEDVEIGEKTVKRFEKIEQDFKEF